MAKLPWGIVWEVEPVAPDLTLSINDPVNWTIKAIPDVDPMAVLPDTAIMPTVTQYEILVNNLIGTVIVDVSNPSVGVQLTGNISNPFVFTKIGYVTPKGEGFTEIVVSTVPELPDYSTIDISAFVPSGATDTTDTITIRATASDFDTPTPDTYQITGVFSIKTLNNWSDVKTTLDTIIAS